MPLNQKNKDCIEELKSLGDTSGIFDRWKIASKMRIWIQEKQKDISEQVKKRVEAENTEKDEKNENNENSKEEEKIETGGEEKSLKISEEDILKMELEAVDALLKNV